MSQKKYCTVVFSSHDNLQCYVTIISVRQHGQLYDTHVSHSSSWAELSQVCL